jgi:LacI family transcriptional regulator, galactose operon repressor
MSSRATIRDVAALAGVSIGTVSRALRGYPDVAAHTHATVHEAAQTLGYRPAAAARTVRLGRSGLVGAFLSPCGESAENLQPFGRLVVAGLAKRLSDHDVAVLDVERVDGLIDQVTERQLDAAVLVAVDGPTLANLDPADVPCPLVGVDTACPIEVRTDSARGIVLAVEHLAALGHRRIAFAGAQRSTVAGGERLRGFDAAVAALGLDRDERLRHEGDFSRAGGHSAATALLALDPRPSAIVAVSDLVAAGVCAAAAAGGLRIPHDLSVTGFDDLEVAQLLSPPLTTVRQDPDALGALAADVVRALVYGGHAESALVAPDLTVRGSSGPAYAAAATGNARRSS